MEDFSFHDVGASFACILASAKVAALLVFWSIGISFAPFGVGHESSLITLVSEGGLEYGRPVSWSRVCTVGCHPSRESAALESLTRS
jgi:hypothetical protein